jgi:hypothetical protein
VLRLRVCEEHNLTGCTINGRIIRTLPDEHCLRGPDLDQCVAINHECPEGFIVSNSANWTNSRCLPLSYEDAQDNRRERQVLDQNRCSEGYWLDVDPIFDEGSRNIGRCIVK